MKPEKKNTNPGELWQNITLKIFILLTALVTIITRVINLVSDHDNSIVGCASPFKLCHPPEAIFKSKACSHGYDAECTLLDEHCSIWIGVKPHFFAKNKN